MAPPWIFSRNACRSAESIIADDVDDTNWKSHKSAVAQISCWIVPHDSGTALVYVASDRCFSSVQCAKMSMTNCKSNNNWITLFTRTQNSRYLRERKESKFATHCQRRQETDERKKSSVRNLFRPKCIYNLIFWFATVTVACLFGSLVTIQFGVSADTMGNQT